MRDRSSRLAQLQALVTFGVVASFLTAGFVVAHHATAVGSDADAMVGRVLPTIEELSSTRGAMFRLNELTQELADRARTGRGQPTESVGACIRDIEASLAAYPAMTASPKQKELFAQARTQITSAETSARAVARAIDAGDASGAERELANQQRAAARVDEGLHALVGSYVAEADDLGRDIAAVRRSTRHIAFLLDGVAVFMAILATALSGITVRRGVKALERASALAELKSTELDRFAGRVAHDILSPLGAMHLALSLIGARLGGDEIAESALARASRSVTRVKTLVEGLLHYARAGAQPDPESRTEVSHVVRDVLDEMQKDAQERGIDIEIDGAEGATVASSVGVLTSLVSNLVQNAIKYMGDRPTRVITVRTRTSDERVRVEVEDTGPGLPPAIADSIFEPFVRGVSDETGIGLGLATVRQLVRAHGGKVSVRSKPGNGSLFWFELPRAPDPGASPPPSSPRQHQPIALESQGQARSAS